MTSAKTMDSLTDLPSEIVVRIIQYLDERNQRSLLATCQELAYLVLKTGNVRLGVSPFLDLLPRIDKAHITYYNPRYQEYLSRLQTVSDLVVSSNHLQFVPINKNLCKLAILDNGYMPWTWLYVNGYYPRSPRPQNLTSMRMDGEYNSGIASISTCFPKLVDLELVGRFNKELVGISQLHLTHLRLGDAFNQKLHYLPPTLTHLHVGDGYTQPLDTAFYAHVQQLEYLYLGIRFAGCVDINCLPRINTIEIHCDARFKNCHDNKPVIVVYHMLRVGETGLERRPRGSPIYEPNSTYVEAQGVRASRCGSTAMVLRVTSFSEHLLKIILNFAPAFSRPVAI